MNRQPGRSRGESGGFDPLAAANVTQLSVHRRVEYGEEIVVGTELGRIPISGGKQVDHMVDRFYGGVKIGAGLPPNPKSRRGRRIEADMRQAL